MRSASVSWLANMLDIKTIILKKGYKSYRNWVIKQFKNKLPIKLLGGKTGTGKTDILLLLARKGISIIDLEGLANHRGSSFGALGRPIQPTSEHFENLLAENLEHCTGICEKNIWIEAESANLGKCRIPKTIFNQMQKAPLLEITKHQEERVQIC